MALLAAQPTNSSDFVPPTAHELRADKLSLAYNSHPVIDELDLDIPVGKVTAIVGPNGCGKSTLLAGLARLHQPKAGMVLLDGKSLAKYSPREVAQKIGLLPQSAEAPDGLTVHDLVRFGRHPHQGFLRQWSEEDREAVAEAIRVADLEDLADRPLDSLSGGQRQRAWIAMAVAQNTPLLLLDEPTAALDLGHQIEVFELIRSLAAQGKTVVMVVHDVSSACRYADHIVAMYEGKIVTQGPPVEVVTPELVRTLYQIDCMLVPDPLTGCPLIAAVRRSGGKLSGVAGSETPLG
jgi:iron complex transport system ATP-binding protein